MLHPTVYNTSQLCHQLGVRHAVMSPGSRNAPLTISFARHPEIKKWIFPDERTAGFVALGIAQSTKTPVVLCCTSGSALLNYAPAISEAYYREIPLIVLSADRPPELIDQRDGQTIRQFEALKNHVKATYQLPVITGKSDEKAYISQLTAAIINSEQLPQGPVHVNIPFREPFYPSAADALAFEQIQLKADKAVSAPDIQAMDLSEYRRILILVGQHPKDQELNEALGKLSTTIPVIQSPLNNLEQGITLVDGFINNQKELAPDLLITSGLSVLSKKLKHFIRSHPPKRHLHFDPAGIPVDTYQTHPELIQNRLSDWLGHQSLDGVATAFLAHWKKYKITTRQALNEYFTQQNTFSESGAVFELLKHIPDNSSLHLSNSMPVRYVDLFGVRNGIEVFANRGTSGIDGCTSTVVGTSLVSDQLNVLLTGDLAFLYDRNAFFHNYSLPNLRIIVLNNQGGGIFRLIDGPSRLPELEEYFETRHHRTAEYICAENKLDYFTAGSFDELSKQLSDFFKPGENTKILEVFTDPKTNQNQFKALKNHINERINSMEEGG